jgi:hypothetical protein
MTSMVLCGWWINREGSRRSGCCAALRYCRTLLERVDEPFINHAVYLRPYHVITIVWHVRAMPNDE